MKKVVLTLAIAVLSFGAFAQKKISDVAKFESETIDFGKIKQGVPVKGTFTVTNIGNEPLIIEQANPTCGCTISDYTKSPIAPGKTGVINATYNAAALNHFEKHLTVKFAGVDEVKSITFTGEVYNDAPAPTEEAAKLKTAAVATPVEVGQKTVTATKTVITPKVVAAKKIVPAKKATVKKVVLTKKAIVAAPQTEVKQ
jgi:ribosomal 30S subunit maturation factor RimM